MSGSKDLLDGWKALEDAQEAYLEALAYYRGTAAERFANERIQRMVQASGQAYQFRLAAKPVNVMAKRCRIARVTSDLAKVTQRIEQIRLANQATIHEPLIMRKMFTYGDAYALVWPVEDVELEQRDGEPVDVAASEAMQETGVEVSYQSPLHCRILYDAEDGRRARFAIRRWLEPSPLGQGHDTWRAEVWYADRVEPWVTRPGAKGSSREDWEPYAEDDQGERIPAEEGSNWPLEHDWEEIPVKHARTDLPYGEPAHSAAYGPQDAITKAITTQVVVGIEAHGWPERWRILDDARQLESGEAVRWGDAADAPPVVDPFTTDQLQTSSARRRGSGVEHIYPGTKAVGEFQAPDPTELIQPIDQWVKLMSVVTETPLDELDPTVQLSGVSREKAEAPLRAKERDAKSYLDGFWQEVYSLAVRMSGIAEPGTISVHWTPPEVTMDGDWWATAQVRLNMGVPIRQILTEANYLADQVDAWLDEQGEEMALIQRIQTLERLGAAIQALGVGVQMGVLGQDAVGRIVERVIGELETEPVSDPA